MSGKTGLLWMPNEKAWKMAEEILKAAPRFQQKFGKYPTTCHTRQEDLPDDYETMAGIKIVPDGTITPGHFLLTEEIENDGKI